MADSLLTKKAISEMLATSPGKAAAILMKAGCNPALDLGRGRGNGPRWLESAVVATIRKIHMDAQPKPRNRKAKAPAGDLNLLAMNAKELEASLKQSRALTSCDTVQ